MPVVTGIALVLLAASATEGEKYTNSTGMRMIRIKPGTFLMGSLNPTPPEKLQGPKHLPNGDWDEKPVHNVTISKPFYISETEITIEQFQKFRPDYEDHRQFTPFASTVSWHDATAFCQWLSKEEGKTYRLPTEAEWEYACRAGTRTLFSSGDNPPKHGERNAWGLVNMHTGAPEWCLDWHGMYPDDDQVDPVGPERGIARVVRGGGLQQDSPYYSRSANRGGALPEYSESIGFRVVQGPMPQTRPVAYEAPFVQQCVKQSAENVPRGPEADKPYFRKRYLLPIPPENVPAQAIQAAGLHPAFLGHNHSPAMEICPNGDILAIYYTSVGEYSPDVALIAARLRFGSEEWEIPSLLLDFPDVNDHAPLLWNDNGTLRLFWGGPGFKGVPFRWCSSGDSGATWDTIRFPTFTSAIGDHSPQPINTAFRDSDGTVYVSSDGKGGTSLLWVSQDNGETWLDTGGRTGGRHTTFVPLKDGSILGMGGKNTDIDGFMPKSTSRDGGRTWEISKTPFPALGANQRPSVLRLASGRLFFASDFQHFQGNQPKGITELGAFVALSDDEGETWHIKKLPGAQLHERPRHQGATIGYSVARQAPNGLIHLITSMNHPSLHFEMNEAWILQKDDHTEEEPNTSYIARVEGQVLRHQERYPDGKLKAVWSGGISEDGRYLLHGKQTWYYEDGSKQWEVTYQHGRKVGIEAHWSRDGIKKWEWDHQEDGTSVWTQWWPNGGRKAESSWRDSRCEGIATRWDRSGKVISKHEFANGNIVKRNP